VNEGEILALVGPNGSGKSTLIKTIFGIASTFAGEIVFDKREITDEKPENIASLGLGYVPQVSNVFADMTVTENLELGAIPSKKSKLEKRTLLEEIADMFPILRERAGQRARSLSGGERQMLAVARALMAQPRLLLLDEPTAALAPMVAESLFGKLLEIRKTGVTMVIAEQNARMALSLVSRGFVLVQGKKAFEGPPKEISQDREIIKLFLGELPTTS
jgi:ABC-type branched-subunit amino acid transport system ATPase component